MSLTVPATIAASSALLYTLITVSYVRLAQIRRLGREYGFFSVFTFGLAIASVGATLICRATDTHASETGLRVESIGILISLAGFANFAYPNVQLPLTHAGRLATVLAIVGIIGVAAGLAFDPGVAIQADRAFGPAAYPQPAMTPLGSLMGVGAFVTALKVTFEVGASERRTITGRLVLLAVIAGHCMWLGILVLRMTHHSVGPWFSVVLAPFVALVAAALVQRWGDVDVQLERRGVELEHAYAELQSAQSELVRREQLAAVGELSAVIAHEVRNPLAVLKNAVSGLRRDNLAPDIRETLHTILDQETDRLNRLVRDLLSYAKPILVGHTDTDVRAMLERVIQHGRALDPSTSRLVEVDLSVDAPDSIRADPDLLERALTHVIENAFQAMPSGGRIEITVQRVVDGDAPHLAISVSDSGEGMDTLVRSRATEPFFTTRREGTGLGLAIVERVASSHGGKLELAKNADGGSRVTLIIPETETRGATSDPPRRSKLLTQS